MGKDVRLKCGTGDAQSGWGYKHIRDGKESDWQAKLNAARAAGWDSEAQGVESWDDLMSGATASAVMWPEYRRVSPVNNTTCGVTEIFFAKKNNPNQIVYSHCEIGGGGVQSAGSVPIPAVFEASLDDGDIPQFHFESILELSGLTNPRCVVAR